MLLLPLFIIARFFFYRQISFRSCKLQFVLKYLFSDWSDSWSCMCHWLVFSPSNIALWIWMLWGVLCHTSWLRVSLPRFNYRTDTKNKTQRKIIRAGNVKRSEIKFYESDCLLCSHVFVIFYFSVVKISDTKVN